MLWTLCSTEKMAALVLLAGSHSDRGALGAQRHGHQVLKPSQEFTRQSVEGCVGGRLGKSFQEVRTVSAKAGKYVLGILPPSLPSSFHFFLPSFFSISEYLIHLHSSKV